MTILPGGCCHGNAIAMIAHSCLINWFFNASWFVRTLKVHGKWKINGFPSSVFLLATSSCFTKCTDGVVELQLEVDDCHGWRRLQISYLKCKRNMFWFMPAFFKQLLKTESNVV